MRVIYFGNNLVGLKVLEFLKESNVDVVGLVVHPEERQKYATEMIKVSGLSECNIFDAGSLRDAEIVESIKALKPELGISVYFGYILRSEMLSLFPKRCLNLHPSYLPYNRGSYPNVWSIVDNTPAGATLHYLDEGIDTGSILARKEIVVESSDTGESLYRRLESACVELFEENWEAFCDGELDPIPQDPRSGTGHKIKDIHALDKIDLNKEYKARELINILRARSFPPFTGAYFEENGHKVYLELKLEKDED